MSRAFVTGASGFVGANLVRTLLSQGHEVYATVREGSDLWRINDIRKDLDMLVNLDFGNDYSLLLGLISDIRPNWVFNMAAYGGFHSQSNIATIYQVNLMGVLHLYDILSKQPPEVFIHAGSSSEYGPKTQEMSESDYLNPESFYAASKAAASLYLSSIKGELNSRSMSNKFDIYTARLFSVYGPYEGPTRFVPKLLVSGISSNYPPLANNSIARDFIYIQDVIHALILLAKGDYKKSPHHINEIYNLGTGTQTTLGEAAYLSKKIFGIAEDPIFGSFSSRGSWDPTIWKANPSKLFEHTGWKANTGFEEGLIKTRDWLENSGYLEFYQQSHKVPV